MTQVRRPLIATLALFTGAITLDRLDLGTDSDVIAIHVYVIAVLFLALPLVSAGLRRTTPWIPSAAAAGVTTISSLVIGSGPIADGGAHLAATQLAFVALAAYLGRTLAVNLEGFDDLLTVAAFGESPALDLEGPTAANEIHTEIARSRRHSRPMSVTVIAPTARGIEAATKRASIEVDRAVRRRFLFSSLAKTVAGQLRRGDLLFEHRPTGRLIVLSPETDADGTALLIKRVLDATDHNGIETRAGTASFPDDGIGFESLVSHAEASIAESVEPHLRAVEYGGLA